MTCGSQSLTLSRPIYADGSGTAWFGAFHRMPIGSWTRARISRAQMDAQSTSGKITATTALRYGNVESDFSGSSGTGMSTPISISGDGITFGGAFQDLSGAYRLVEFGVLVVASGGSSQHEMAQLSLQIDLQA